MANLNKRSKLETDKSEPRPIAGSDSSDGEQIQDLENLDEGLAFINEGNL